MHLAGETGCWSLAGTGLTVLRSIVPLGEAESSRQVPRTCFWTLPCAVPELCPLPLVPAAQLFRVLVLIPWETCDVPVMCFVDLGSTPRSGLGHWDGHAAAVANRNQWPASSNPGMELTLAMTGSFIQGTHFNSG